MNSVESVIEAYLGRVAELREHERGYLAELTRIRTEIAVIEAKVEGFKEAISLMESPPKGRTRSRGADGKRGGISEAWQKILQTVHTRWEGIDDSFDYDDLEQAADRIGHQSSRDNLRSQMSIYRGRGWVEAVSEGRFRLTADGLAAINLSPTEEDDNAPSADERAPSPSETRKRFGGSFEDDLDDDTPF